MMMIETQESRQSVNVRVQGSAGQGESSWPQRERESTDDYDLDDEDDDDDNEDDEDDKDERR